MEAGFIPAGGAGGGAMAAPPVLVANSGNVIRAPGLKRGKMEEAISDRVSSFNALIEAYFLQFYSFCCYFVLKEPLWLHWQPIIISLN